MVKANYFSALGFNGIYDWLLLRISAIIIAFYIIYIGFFFITTDTMDYIHWHNFFASKFTKIFTMIALFSNLIHSWIGIWQVLTDYIKSLILRLILQMMHFLLLCVYIIYGIMVIWSV
ncbi:MAG: succinate dehydrogenase, hydrophobic membrane anchor protein [Candidatus Dasytiphilus stammeri]